MNISKLMQGQDFVATVSVMKKENTALKLLM